MVGTRGKNLARYCNGIHMITDARLGKVQSLPRGRRGKNLAEYCTNPPRAENVESLYRFVKLLPHTTG